MKLVPVRSRDNCVEDDPEASVIHLFFIQQALSYGLEILSK